MSEVRSFANCTSCGAELATGLLACPGCGLLTHREALTTLTRAADACAREGDLSAALQNFRTAYDLLPAGTKQRSAIEARMKDLSARIDGRRPDENEKEGGRNTGKVLGGLSVLGLVILKSKALLALLLSNLKLLLLGLTKLPTLLSMLLYARWTHSDKVGFALGLVGSIYVHEIGHVAALKRYGISASAPMFIPGLGALVRLKQYPTDAHEDARTGLSGPLWGLGAAIVCFGIGKAFASSTAISVASLGATINLFNLIPVWQLDGSRGLHALSKNQRFVVATVALLTALFAKQWMPLCVFAAALVRAFMKDVHAEGDRSMLALFCGLIMAHAALATLKIGPCATAGSAP